MNKKTSEEIGRALLELMGEDIEYVSVGVDEEGFFCRVVTDYGEVKYAFGDTVQDAYINMQHMIAGTNPPPF